MKNNRERHKAFIGSIIGAVGSLVGGLISSNKQKKAAAKQEKSDNRNKNFQYAYTDAQNLTEGHGNQDYVDEYYNRVITRLGGNRKKASVGTWLKENKDELISGGASALGNIGSAIITSQANVSDGVVTNASMFASKPKTSIKNSNYNTDNVINGAIDLQYSDRNNLYRCGGRKKRK